VAVDAVMDQVPADPTHIRLVVGGLERQVELVRVMGKLGIRVVGYEHEETATRGGGGA
jgi:hypothetical protein